MRTTSLPKAVYVVLLAFLFISQSLNAQEEPAMPQASWENVDRLIAEQRFEAAAEQVEALLEAARGADDVAEWTRALVRKTQLRIALHGPETAVRELRAAARPDDARSRLVLDLFYAHALQEYFQRYGWEILQRERTVSGDEVDLRAWTSQQLVEAANETMLRVWREREDWGVRSLDELSQFIQPNNDPPHIRGTLRDVVARLWLGLLGNSSWWSPEDGETYRLDADALIRGDIALNDDDLASPETHPLHKIAALTAELEAWHQSDGRTEAAFEARLERLRRLAQQFSSDDVVHAAIRDEVARSTDELGRSFPWWSMGRYESARMMRDADLPGRLAKAHEIALEGARAHPESVGGTNCRHLVESIEQPALEMQTMRSDAVNRRSILINSRNLSKVHFRAWRLDLRETVARGTHRLLPEAQEIRGLVERPADVSWSTSLHRPGDYESHRTFVTSPIEEEGLWVIAASAREDFSKVDNQLAAVNLLLGDLVILSRPAGDRKAELTVRRGADGAGAAGAQVDLYRYDFRSGKHYRVETATADDEGRAVFTVELRNRYFAVAEHDGQTQLLETVQVGRETKPRQENSALVFTDRSVYRPGQTLHWKIVAFHQDPANVEQRFRVLSRKVEVTLYDQNREIVDQVKVKTNPFGSASGSFTLASDRALGHWSLEASIGGSAGVRVEEYKRPTFEATLDDPEGELAIGRPAEIAGTVRYYFGLPVTSGEARWRVTREPVFRGWWFAPRIPTRTVAAGTSNLDADGRFFVRWTPEADPRGAEGDISYRFRIHAEITDEGGETRDVGRSFRLGFVAVEASIKKEQDFYDSGECPTVNILRTDLNGNPRAGLGTWRLIKLDEAEPKMPADLPRDVREFEKTETSAEDDLRRARWETSYDPYSVLEARADGKEIKRGEARHGDDGNAEFELPKLKAGVYRLRYETKDDAGAAFKTQELILVGGKRSEMGLAGFLEVQESSVEVGESARLLVGTAWPDQEFTLEVLREGKTLDRRRLSGASRTLDLKVPESWRGGVIVRFSLLRDHQLIKDDRRIDVPQQDRRLNVELSTFRDLLRPGAEESWRLTLRGVQDERLDPEDVEVLVSMYDRSLDLFYEHGPADPLRLGRTSVYAVGLQSSLGSTRPVWRDGGGFPRPASLHPRIDDRLLFLDGYGIGGPGRRGGMVRRARAMSLEETAMDGMMIERGGEAEVFVVAEAPRVEVQKAQAGMTLSDGARGPSEPESSEPPPSEPPPSSDEPQIRRDFSETAFWYPHLLLDEDGGVSFEFTVPDAVTEWTFWTRAHTPDLKAGNLEQRVRSAKELMARPYLPRFLREGDRAEIRVAVDNAGERPLSGTVELEILDPETGVSRLDDFGVDMPLAEFEIEPGLGTTAVFELNTPRGVGEVVVRAIAQADDVNGGQLSDGEQRPLPILPSRQRLIESRFAALSASGEDRRTLSFEIADDPTRVEEQLVVALEGQLIGGVLGALPYLVDYPYNCTEQTLNRFLAAGIVSQVFADHPAVAAIAKQRADARGDKIFEAWDAEDPNRALRLEETPWLRVSRGGDWDLEHELLRILDPEIALALRKKALADLKKTQTASGGFPWWSGGPPSPGMTLYLLRGFARALEHGIDVPQEMVVSAWRYMRQEWETWLKIDEERHWRRMTELNWVLSSYPDVSWTGGVFTDDDRDRMLRISLKHRRDHSPYLKGQLALTLARAGRVDEALGVWESVMDSARTDEDLGTYWMPEERAWLWYNDTVETHAFALRVLSELAPEDPRRAGLAQWLFLDKKLGHWKSTRATAEAIYALTHYLDAEEALGVQEKARVSFAGETREFVFEPDEPSTRQWIFEEPELEEKAEIVVEKSTPGLMFASATRHYSTEALPEASDGDLFSVDRRFFLRRLEGSEHVLEPIEEDVVLGVGDQVEVHLSIRAKHAAEYVHLRDPRGAGFEPESTTSGYRWGFESGVAHFEEIRDSGTNFFFEWLPAGEYTFKYRLRASTAGAFRVAPAQLQSMYAPEFAARSAGARLEIEP